MICGYSQNRQRIKMSTLILFTKIAKEMKWIRINTKKLPTGEVLAGNFKPLGHGYKEKMIGNLELDEGEELAHCCSEDNYLGNCTHYIPIDEHDPGDVLV